MVRNMLHTTRDDKLRPDGHDTLLTEVKADIYDLGQGYGLQAGYYQIFYHL